MGKKKGKSTPFDMKTGEVSTLGSPAAPLTVVVDSVEDPSSFGVSTPIANRKAALTPDVTSSLHKHTQQYRTLAPMDISTPTDLNRTFEYEFNNTPQHTPGQSMGRGGLFGGLGKIENLDEMELIKLSKISTCLPCGSNDISGQMNTVNTPVYMESMIKGATDVPAVVTNAALSVIRSKQQLLRRSKFFHDYIAVYSFFNFRYTDIICVAPDAAAKALLEEIKNNCSDEISDADEVAYRCIETLHLGTRDSLNEDKTAYTTRVPTKSSMFKGMVVDMSAEDVNNFISICGGPTVCLVLLTRIAQACKGVIPDIACLEDVLRCLVLPYLHLEEPINEKSDLFHGLQDEEEKSATSPLDVSTTSYSIVYGDEDKEMLKKKRAENYVTAKFGAFVFITKLQKYPELSVCLNNLYAEDINLYWERFILNKKSETYRKLRALQTKVPYTPKSTSSASSYSNLSSAQASPMHSVPSTPSGSTPSSNMSFSNMNKFKNLPSPMYIKEDEESSVKSPTAFYRKRVAEHEPLSCTLKQLAIEQREMLTMWSATVDQIKAMCVAANNNINTYLHKNKQECKINILQHRLYAPMTSIAKFNNSNILLPGLVYLSMEDIHELLIGGLGPASVQFAMQILNKGLEKGQIQGTSLRTFSFITAINILPTSIHSDGYLHIIRGQELQLRTKDDSSVAPIQGSIQLACMQYQEGLKFAEDDEEVPSPSNLAVNPPSLLQIAVNSIMYSCLICNIPVDIQFYLQKAYLLSQHVSVPFVYKNNQLTTAEPLDEQEEDMFLYPTLIVSENVDPPSLVVKKMDKHVLEQEDNMDDIEDYLGEREKLKADLTSYTNESFVYENPSEWKAQREVKVKKFKALPKEERYDWESEDDDVNQAYQKHRLVAISGLKNAQKDLAKFDEKFQSKRDTTDFQKREFARQEKQVFGTYMEKFGKASVYKNNKKVLFPQATTSVASVKDEELLFVSEAAVKELSSTVEKKVLPVLKPEIREMVQKLQTLQVAAVNVVEATVEEVKVDETTIEEAKVDETTVEEAKVDETKDAEVVEEVAVVVEEVAVAVEEVAVAVEEVAEDVSVEEVAEDVTEDVAVEEVTEDVAVEEVAEDIAVNEVAEDVAVEEVTEDAAVEEVTEEVTEDIAVEEVSEEVTEDIAVEEVSEEVTEDVAVEEVTEDVAVEEVTEDVAVEDIAEDVIITSTIDDTLDLDKSEVVEISRNNNFVLDEDDLDAMDADEEEAKPVFATTTLMHEGGNDADEDIFDEIDNLDNDVDMSITKDAATSMDSNDIDELDDLDDFPEEEERTTSSSTPLMTTITSMPSIPVVVVMTPEEVIAVEDTTLVEEDQVIMDSINNNNAPSTHNILTAQEECSTPRTVYAVTSPSPKTAFVPVQKTSTPDQATQDYLAAYKYLQSLGLLSAEEEAKLQMNW